MPEYNFVREILRPYLRDSGRWKKPNTVRAEASIARVLERYFHQYWLTGAPADLRQHRLIITGRVVAEYRQCRKQEGVCPNSISRELVVASGACRHAISELNYDVPNPFAGRLISRSDARTVQPRRRQLEAHEANSLLIACPQPLRDMVLLWLETGLRVTELRLLRHAQIDRERRIIAFAPGEHKSGDFSASALTAEALAIIERQPQADCDYVFTRAGAPLTYGTLQTMFWRARATAGCPDLQLRDLRRTALQRWRDSFGIEAAQAQARHKSRQTTEAVYARPSVTTAVEALKTGVLK